MRNSPQAVFDACVVALMTRTAFPNHYTELASTNSILSEFRHIREAMAPRTWKAEVQDMAADYGLDFDVELWDRQAPARAGKESS